LDGGPRTDIVVAETDMELLVLSRSEFSGDDFLAPSVARKMLAELAARLRRAEQKSEDKFLTGVESGLLEPNRIPYLRQLA
jgi:CRP-like cAMP-binding protein